MVMRNQIRHVSLDRMADLARGRLPSAEEQSIHSHTMSCAHCAALMTRIERIVAVTGADDTEDVPPHVVARSVRLMRQRSAALQPPSRRRLIATLRFDSARVRVALGKRSRPSSARQVVFETGQHDVDVRIKSVAVGWVVWGQLLGPVAGGQAELQGPATVQTELNSQGEFSLSPVPPGTYTLTLRLDDVEIGMELDIGT
jgi:anti-sigma factor RsiW